MLKVEIFVEDLALLRRQRGIEDLCGGEARFLRGDMFFGKSQHLFHAIRRRQTSPRFLILALFLPARMIALDLANPFSSGNLLVRVELEI